LADPVGPVVSVLTPIVFSAVRLFADFALTRWVAGTQHACRRVMFAFAAFDRCPKSIVEPGGIRRMTRTGSLLARWAGLAFALAALPLAAQSHFPDPVFHDGMEGVAAGPFSDADAARFLAQATFGPTDADIAHLRAIGYQAWLDEQFAATPTSELVYVDWVANTLLQNTGDDTVREAWLVGALGGPDPQNMVTIHSDQLRQRVAFALSEIFVISEQNTLLSQHPDGLAYYYDILSDNAFGNFRTLLEQVTLSPEMGIYLNMLGNPRADLTKNLHPDENYAREINQLFSIGLEMLNDDGTLKLAAGKPIPTYDQAVVTAFSHVFTGWNWADCTSGNFSACGYHGLDFQTQMAAFPAHHDNGSDLANDIVSKQLLDYQDAANGGIDAVNGGILVAGGSPQSDLGFALDNIFNHPNVPPFISRQLIQRLVTSNPSPAYVHRVVNVFRNDGANVRGNLQAVVKAILLDPEARYGQFWQPTTFGKLREPLLRLTHFWRAMGAQHNCANPSYQGGSYVNAYRYSGYGTASSLADTVYGSGVGQAPLNADSVFNFFKPGFLPPGEMTALGLLGPEFQINTDTIATNTTTSTGGKAWTFDLGNACGGSDDPLGNVKINRSQDLALAANANGGAADPADALVDAYNVRFLSGQMSPFMRQTLLDALNPLSSVNYNAGAFANFRLERISMALWLIQNSPEYMIQK
jgi:uncharacterized protein (DUF1800 family)